MNPDRTIQNDPWLAFGVKQLELFEKDPAAFCELLVTASGLRNSMLAVYNAMMRYTQGSPIEALPVEEKERFWAFAKKLANGRLNNQQCIDLAKILYMLE